MASAWKVVDWQRGQGSFKMVKDGESMLRYVEVLVEVLHEHHELPVGCTWLYKALGSR